MIVGRNIKNIKKTWIGSNKFDTICIKLNLYDYEITENKYSLPTMKFKTKILATESTSSLTNCIDGH